MCLFSIMKLERNFLFSSAVYDFGLDIANCCGQGYDGASSARVGERAVYTAPHFGIT